MVMTGAICLPNADTDPVFIDVLDARCSIRDFRSIHGPVQVELFEDIEERRVLIDELLQIVAVDTQELAVLGGADVRRAGNAR